MRIYLSATYRDLRDHRQAVSVALRRMGHQVIGMEEYVAEGVRPLHRCLDDVRQCDAYVGIVAWRYGHQPTDAGVAGTALPPLTSVGTTSMTEFEFRHAVHTGRPILAFLLDPEAAWPSSQIDALTGTADAAARVARLREEIAQQYLAGYFRTPDELASLVSAAVYRLEMTNQLALDSLRIEAGLNQPYIQSPEHGHVEDSALGTIRAMVTEPQGLRALRIDLGPTSAWWMTRLYFLCSLAADLTQVESVVFVGADDAFVGVAHPRIVRDRLAQAYAALRAYEKALVRRGDPPVADVPGEVERRARAWRDAMDAAGGEQTLRVFVTPRELERWLGPYMLSEAIQWDAAGNPAVQVQRLLDWPMRFVPIVERARFTKIVDKQALTDQVARLFVREQVSRALSTMR